MERDSKLLGLLGRQKDLRLVRREAALVLRAMLHKGAAHRVLVVALLRIVGDLPLEAIIEQQKSQTLPSS